ncbi:MAG: radical SAM protein [Candidatus Omnitrophota bacterium]|nr:MAG: radical SAM protein [Candidatus Omnitrophota bacterium]
MMNILAINPWIVDFAAYDFWLKPYGFLVILSYLKSKGITLNYIDCLDKKITQGTFGRGKYYSERVEKPPILKSIPRIFKRYGMTKEELTNQLKGKRPDFILLTSSMTYWYPALRELAMILKRAFPGVPIILGGTYASLCYEHANNTIPCDFIFKNEQLKKLFTLLGLDFDYENLYSHLPSYEDFYRKSDYVILRTSWGCPFSCSYCAIKKLSGGFFRIPLETVREFIFRYAQKGIKDFVLYDDAFLYEPEHVKKLLHKIHTLNVRFHTPNALHLKFLDKEIARLLKESGFINPHFGLETLNPRLQKTWGDKVNKTDLLEGIKALKKGGFQNGEFSVYLLLGYPGQNLKKLRREVDLLHSLGAKVSLSEFSPVPHTEIFQQYPPPFTDPLLHNNSIFGFFTQNETKTEGKMRAFWKMKNYARGLNKKLSGGQ